MKLYRNSNASSPEEIPHSNYLENNTIEAWRALLDFAENNRLPKLPGVDIAIVSEVFGPVKPSVKSARNNYISKNSNK